MLAAADPGNVGVIALIAAVTAIVGLAAVQLAKVLGRWFRKAIVDSVADGIREITAPDLDALAQSVTAAIEELSASIATAIHELSEVNGAQHELVDGRLTVVENRLTDVENRLSAVEKGMGMRSPRSRTRATDEHPNI